MPLKLLKNAQTNKNLKIFIIRAYQEIRQSPFAVRISRKFPNWRTNLGAGRNQVNELLSV